LLNSIDFVEQRPEASRNGGDLMLRRFINRKDAGRQLATALSKYAGRQDLQILALPRGGVPVAFEVACALKAPLDVLMVRKLGVPGQDELAMGAITSGGSRVINEGIVNSLGISQEAINAVVAKEELELARRESLYRGTRAFPSVGNRIVILIDDGIATGATIRAAVKALRQHQPALIIVATPIAPPEVCADLQVEVDELVCLIAPEMIDAVGLWYIDFGQTSDEEVCALLTRAATEWGIQANHKTHAG
jgi:putative phosphoribosyl transferase